MNDNTDFTQGSIVKKMLRFMLPILGAQILQAMYGAVDILVVGRFGTTAGLSGVSTGSNIVNMVTFVLTGLAMGVTVLIGRYIGEGRTEKVGKVIGGAIAVFAAIAIVLSAVLLLFARPIALLMQAPEEAIDLTVTYVRICGGGLIFIIFYNVIASIFRGFGDSNTPLIFVAIACCANIAGDLLFVAVLHMNVAGAALATVMAQAISVILSVIIIKRKSFPFTMTMKDIGFNREARRFVQIGFPIAFQEFMTQISFLCLCAFINNLGLEASSGYGVAQKIVTFVMLVPGSLMQSMASFVSQNVGAGLEKRARKAMLTGMCIGGTIGVAVFTAVMFFGAPLSSIFTTDAAVVARSAEYLRGYALEAVVTAVLFSFIGYYNGHEQTFFVLIQGLAQTFLVRLPMSYFMSIQPDASLTGIGLAAPTATMTGIAINLIYFVIYSKRKRLEEVDF